MTALHDKLAKVHHLPCTIEHTGEAPVGSYFMPHDTGLSFHVFEVGWPLTCLAEYITHLHQA